MAVHGSVLNADDARKDFPQRLSGGRVPALVNGVNNRQEAASRRQSIPSTGVEGILGL
jgi:hypothetical protein